MQEGDGTSRAREWWREEVPYTRTVDTKNCVISPVFSIIPLQCGSRKALKASAKGLGKTQIDTSNPAFTESYLRE